jgi:hypothetical protein
MYKSLLILINILALGIEGFPDSSSSVASDASATHIETRMEDLERQQEAKDRNLVPSQSGRVERLLDRIIGENPMNKYAGNIPGLYLRFGGLESGAGFGIGLEYLRPDLAEGLASFRASAVGSTRHWYRIETELQFPYLAGRYLDLKILGRRLDLNSVDYYGSGADSLKSARTNFRREENAVDIALAFKPVRNSMIVGFVAGYLALNIGPGTSPDSESSERRFFPDRAPGIDRQAHYLLFGPFLEVDSRDKPDDPHAGTHLLIKFSRFDGRRYHLYSFRQINGSLEQHIPFHNRKRVIALRAYTVLNYPDEGNEVPFYMQPTLGGNSDLRGYRQNRFSDNNLFLVGSEYRWEVFTLMDAALFADAGSVFRRDGDFDFSRMKSDAGFGFRFKTREAVVFRIDSAFGHEGFRLWFVFDHAF